MKHKSLRRSDVCKDLKFKHINHNLSVFNLGALQPTGLSQQKYTLDFDVYLPSIQKNLQREFCWTLMQKQAYITSLVRATFSSKTLRGFAFVQKELTDTSIVLQIIDGKQRISTIQSFLNNEFPIQIKGADYLWKDFDLELKAFFLSIYVSGIVVYEYPDDIIPDALKIDWYEQLDFLGTLQDIDHLKSLRGIL